MVHLIRKLKHGVDIIVIEEIMDPVHEDNDKWYFWDETWANRRGPYETEAQARRELRKYEDNL
jgi:hypothetical protein